MTPAAFSFSEIPVAVNWHMLDACNYRCKFCFAKFNNLKGICHDIQKSRTVLLKLKEGGVKKINFTGGEPLLCPTLGELIKYAKELGMATSIVTNGYYLTENPGKELLKEYGEYIDWIGMSLDSGNPEVELALGRAHLGQDGGHVKRVRGAVRLIKKGRPENPDQDKHGGHKAQLEGRHALGNRRTNTGEVEGLSAENRSWSQ